MSPKMRKQIARLIQLRQNNRGAWPDREAEGERQELERSAPEMVEELVQELGLHMLLKGAP